MKPLFAAWACALSMIVAPQAFAADDPATATVAGRFFGSVADAGCASRDVLLDLRSDGRYTLRSHCQDDLQASPVREGAWSVTWNGTCVRLAADDGQAAAYEFAIHDDDLLVLTTGSCIEPVEDPRGRTLRRAADGAESG